MRRLGPTLMTLSLAALCSSAIAYAGLSGAGDRPALAPEGSAAAIRLKDAKLNIEHNATDKDTGFQGFIDSEGWRWLDVRGPGGPVLSFEGRGALARLGLTELFFETVEPENADVPIEQMLRSCPRGNYTIAGPAQENGKRAGPTSGKAWLTHDIPAGPAARLPRGGRDRARARPRRPLEARVKDDHRRAGQDHRLPAHHREGRRAAPAHDRKVGLSMYLPRSVTSIAVPNGFLQRRTAYNWEVLAIEPAATRPSRPARSGRADGRRSSLQTRTGAPQPERGPTPPDQPPGRDWLGLVLAWAPPWW